ncbi:hypothetical protein [Beijerinckia sp. L45]|uniref:hypothetical protein n=1 Tax=Beijerinckia sp. L45 TaxID=1641855 RepID=UPI00131A79C0|nr:hypothetical protein [Beijerinckia sp. L45]
MLAVAGKPLDEIDGGSTTLACPFNAFRYVSEIAPCCRKIEEARHLRYGSRVAALEMIEHVSADVSRRQGSALGDSHIELRPQFRQTHLTDRVDDSVFGSRKSPGRDFCLYPLRGIARQLDLHGALQLKRLRKM